MSTNVFAATLLNKYDRHFGGTIVGVADPYISGYHFIEWIKLPAFLEKFVKYGDGLTASSELGNSGNIGEFLAGSCLSVTPPGGSLEKTEFTALGGIKYAVPTTVTYGNSITLKFLEFSHLPVLGVIGGWVRMIRDYRAGVSHLTDLDGDKEYSKKNYAGTLLYWTTRPDGKTVEYSAAYTGVFPLKDPQDSFTGDFSAVDKLEVDVEFNVDFIWHETWVHEKAQLLSDARHSGMGLNSGKKEQDPRSEISA